MKTIELVGYGHSDRFADYISESILTNILKKDINANVASEVVATKDIIFLAGEVTTQAKIDYEKIVYDAIETVYGNKWWPNYRKSVKVINNIKEQSPELHSIQSKKIVAADQGVIYGYYNETRYKLILNLYELVNHLKNNFDISPDWKLLFSDENKELSISVCGVRKSEHKKIKDFLKRDSRSFLNSEINIIVNPKGEWLICGPRSDTGLTGRKLMIDTFGAGIPHGGGAFCGKDFSKVDKTGVLIATEIAYDYVKSNKNIDEVFVELSYKIGDSKPFINIYDSSKNKLITSKSHTIDLDKWIKKSNVYSVDWSKIVLKGGVIAYFKDRWDIK